MASMWEILEVLRITERACTSEIAEWLGVKTTNITSTLRKLEAFNFIRRTGREIKWKRKLSTEWELTERWKNKLVNENLKSFYDYPPAIEHEKMLIEKRGRKFKRFS